MNKFVIITDSTCDLPQRIVDEYNLDYLPMELNFGEEIFKQYLDERDLKLADFYARLDKGELAKTTLIPSQLFIEKFTPYLEKGVDIFYLGISSALSATWMQTNIAKAELLDLFPKRKIILVDTKTASVGVGLLVVEALKKQKAGATIEQVENHIETLVPHVNAIFVPVNLETLRRGGRISAVKAILGDTLGLKPILKVDNDGKITQVGKARGFKKALLEMLDLTNERIKGKYDGPLYVCHANNEEQANFLVKQFKERHGAGEVLVTPLGPVISAHTGTGAVCLVFLGTHR